MPEVPWPPPQPLQPGNRFRTVIAVDPGDVHVGLAMTSTAGGVTAWEESNEDAVPNMDGRVAALRRGGHRVVLVLEGFSLYDDKAKDQVGSRMLTSQMIGGMKEVARRHGASAVEQGASIKKPLRAQLRARGIKLVGHGPHAVDAELHLYYRLLRSGFDG